MNTTIKLSEATKKSLDELKIHPNQSYDEIVQKIILAGQEKVKRGEEL